MSDDGNQHFFHSEPHTSGVDTGRKRKPPKNLVDGMIKALRPKQWVKNVLVLAAPAAAGADALFHGRVLVDVLLAFIVFCLGASSIYLINDAKDWREDQEHPTKRFRPIASGVLPIKLAYVMAVVLIGLSIGLSFLATAGPQGLNHGIAYGARSALSNRYGRGCGHRRCYRGGRDERNEA